MGKNGPAYTRPDNFKGKRNTNGFDKNPQNINKLGAKPKSFNLFNQTLKKKGIKPVTKTELKEAYQLLFNLSEEELKVASTDTEQPMALRLLASELLDAEFSAKAIQDYRNWVFGSAKQTVESSVESRIEIEVPKEIQEKLDQLFDERY